MENSAYRSLRLAKEGKTKNKNGKLRIWIKEKWLNLNALKDKQIKIPCGQKYKGQTEPTVCRPMIDKSTDNHKTPRPLALDLTKKEIEKAIRIKKQGKNIKWSSL